MSLYDYEASRALAAQDPPFYALIMAAIRKADSDNTDRLKAAFPDTFQELMDRWLDDVRPLYPERSSQSAHQRAGAALGQRLL